MNLDTILQELRAERSKLDAAIAALERINTTGTTRKGRRHMSAAARRAISRAMKRRWAERKGKANGKIRTMHKKAA